MAHHCRIVPTEDEQRVADAERDGHPAAHVRRKMLFVWSRHHGVTRATAGDIDRVSRSTAQRYVAAYREGGLDRLLRCDKKGPVSDLAQHAEAIKGSLTSP